MRYILDINKVQKLQYLIGLVVPLIIHSGNIILPKTEVIYAGDGQPLTLPFSKVLGHQ